MLRAGRRGLAAGLILGSGGHKPLAGQWRMLGGPGTLGLLEVPSARPSGLHLGVGMLCAALPPSISSGSYESLFDPKSVKTKQKKPSLEAASCFIMWTHR